MSFRDRLLITAVGGCVAILVIQILVTDKISAQTNPSDVRSKSEQQGSNTAKGSAPTAKKNQTKTREYQPDCDHPKNASDANFCQSRRSAKAAEDAARAGEDAAKAAWNAAFVAADQLFLAYFGLAGVALTVILTFWAAYATGKSAKSAARSADISLKSLQLSQGGVLDFKEDAFKVSLGEGKDSFNIESRIHNIGKTLGTIEALRTRYHIGPDLPDQPNYRDSPGKLHGAILGPGDAILFDEDPKQINKISEDQMAQILRGEAKYFIYGRLTYRDVLGAVFDRGFAREVEVDRVEKDKFRFRLVYPANVTSSFKYNFIGERGADFAEPALDFVFSVGSYSIADGCKVDFRFINTGKTDLIVEAVSLRYLHVAALPDVPNYGEVNNKWKNKPASQKVIPGAVVTISPAPVGLDAQTFQDVIAQKRSSFIFGSVRYRDVSGRFEAGYVRKIALMSEKNPDNSLTYKCRAETPPGYAQYNFFRRIEQRGIFQKIRLAAKPAATS